MLLAKGGTHFTKHGAGKPVGENGLETVADLKAIAAVVDDEEEEDALVLTLLANTPAPVDRIGDIFDRFAFPSNRSETSYSLK